MLGPRKTFEIDEFLILICFCGENETIFFLYFIVHFPLLELFAFVYINYMQNNFSLGNVNHINKKILSGKNTSDFLSSNLGLRYFWKYTINNVNNLIFQSLKYLYYRDQGMWNSTHRVM